MDVIELRRNIITGNYRLPFRERTAIGNPVSFRTNANKPLNELLIPFLPIQQGTGDPSIENERPIVGRTELNVGRTRKNLLGGIALADAVVSSMPSATIYPDSKYVSFAANASVQHVINGYGSDDPLVYGFKFKENTRYTFILTYDKGTGTLTGSNVKVAYTDGTTANTPTISDPSTKETIVFVSAAGKTIRAFYKSNNSGTTHLYYDESGIFEGVLTAQDFEEWSGNIYPVIFPALGKNLFNPALAEPGYYTDKGAKHAQSGSNYEYRMTNYIPIEGIEKVTVGYANLPSGATKWNSVCWYDENKNFMERSASTSGTNLTVFTVPEGAKYVRANMRTYNNGVEYCFLSYGEEAFEPFDNTIYGATLNAPTGVLTVDKLGVDLGAEEWTYNSQYSRFESTDHTDIKYTKARELQGICSCYPVISDGRGIDQVPDKSIYGGRKSTSASAPRKLYVKDSSFGSDASAFKTAMQGQIFVCELATPYEIHLDHITVQTLIGDNTIWSDTGDDMTVKYLKRG